MFAHRNPSRTLVVLVTLLFVAVGCDSNDPDISATGDATFTGRVTSDEGYVTGSANRSAAGPVRGAVVTAAAVSANGQTRLLQGQATTDAEGRFSLDADGSAGVVVLMAEQADFRSSVLIEAGGAASGSVMAPPMTAESHAEADVYVAARTRSQRVKPADAVAYVSARTAAEIESGATSASDVAASVAAAAEAEAAYLRTDEGGETSGNTVEEGQAERTRGYASFRTRITSAMSVEARTAAVQAFEDAYARAYAEAGVTASHQAQASRAGARAAVTFSGSSDARFATQQQARLYAALATAFAVEEEFRAAGAASSRVSALAQARAALAASIRAAATAEALAQAEAAYEAAVRTELTAEADVSAAALASADTATTAANATLDASVQAAATAEAVAQAYATFFASARTAAETVLGTDAAFAVKVVALLSAF